MKIKKLGDSLLVLMLSILFIGCSDEENGEFGYTSYLDGMYGSGKEFKLTCVIDGEPIESDTAFVVFKLEDSDKGTFTLINLIPGVPEISCKGISMVDNRDMSRYDFSFSKAVDNKDVDITGYLFWGGMSLTITTEMIQ